MIDDIVGITEECRIFGGKIINKTNSIDHMDNVQSDNLYVDNWSVRYEENPITGDKELSEHFIGRTQIGMAQSQQASTYHRA